jgi:hypothetical protein
MGIQDVETCATWNDVCVYTYTDIYIYIYRLKLLKQVLHFLTLLNVAFSVLRIFHYNVLHEMRLVESVRLPPFLSKTDPDFASYARKRPDGWLK